MAVEVWETDGGSLKSNCFETLMGCVTLFISSHHSSMRMVKLTIKNKLVSI